MLTVTQKILSIFAISLHFPFFVVVQSEMQLMKGIVPQKHERTVFDTIIQQALETIVTEGEVYTDNLIFSLYYFRIAKAQMLSAKKAE